MTSRSLRGDEFDRQLAELWNAGLSASKIGAALGVSKNTAVGRARRLDLPQRGNPVGTGGSRVSGEIKRAAIEMRDRGASYGYTERALGISRRTARTIDLGRRDGSRPPQQPPATIPPLPSTRRLSAVPAASAPRIVLAPAASPVPATARGRCCYPIGERDPRRWIGDERVSYLRCEAPAVRGSYCAAHAALCYRRHEAQRQEEAA